MTLLDRLVVGVGYGTLLFLCVCLLGMLFWRVTKGRWDE